MSDDFKTGATIIGTALAVIGAIVTAIRYVMGFEVDAKVKNVESGGIQKEMTAMSAQIVAMGNEIVQLQTKLEHANERVNTLDKTVQQAQLEITTVRTKLDMIIDFLRETTRRTERIENKLDSITG